MSADDKWPLSTTDGVLTCQPPSAVVWTVNGVSYGVNGMASTARGFRDIEEIWLPNADVPGARLPIGILIDQGLKMC